MMKNSLIRILLSFFGIWCVLPTFAQNAKVVLKPHFVFERYPAEFIRETKYNMIESVPVLPGDSLTFSLDVTNPEGEYFKLYGWGALNVFVKPGSVITVDYNDRQRTKTVFTGDLAAENAWLNQSWFLDFQLLYPGKISEQIPYENYRREVFSRADSLQRAVRNVSASRKFVDDAVVRLDFMALGSLLNYYHIISNQKRSKLSPVEFERWNKAFQASFSKNFLKDARKICRRYEEGKALQYGQATRTLMGIVQLVDPEFPEKVGYSLFREEYDVMQLLNDPTRLYSLELLEFGKRLKEPVVLEIVNKHIEEKRDLLTGVEAMDFEFKDPDGNTHKLSDYKGQPLYIDVWATWCNPCKALSPTFHKLAEEYAGKNIKFIAVSLDSKTAPWLNYLKQHAPSEHVLELHTGKKDFSDCYRIEGIPRFILIDKDFKIRMAFAYKPLEVYMKELRTLLDQLSRQ